MHIPSLFAGLLLCTCAHTVYAQHAQVRPRPDAAAHFNRQLADELDTIYHLDQDDRVKAEDIYKRRGTNSGEWEALFKKIKYNDSVNLLTVAEILDKYGWPGIEAVGKQGSETIFLIVQHADLKAQKKYMPLLCDAVAHGKASKTALAMIEDRIAIREHRKQTYGSQVAGDQAGSFLSPLKDPACVDARRASVGMEPIAKYLAQYGIEWNVAAYKKQLPVLEKRQKNIE